jgi:hypothetical protein
MYDEEIFMINTNGKEIQEQLKVKFGVNDPSKTVNDYRRLSEMTNGVVCG